MRSQNVVAGWVVVGLAGVAIGGTPVYEVQDLGSIGVVTSTHPYAINDGGVVVGDTLNNALSLRAFSSSEGPLIDLGESPSDFSRAFGVSESGIIAGWHDDENGIHQASIWLSPETRVALMTPNGFTGSSASDVNDSRLAVGHVVSTVGSILPYAWLPDGQGVPLSDEQGLAVSVNDSGRAVGRLLVDGGFAPVVWDNIDGEPTFTALPDMGSSDALAQAISDTGIVVGSMLSALDEKYHALRWDDGVLTDLGLFEGADPTHANGVNDAGEVVGSRDLDGADETRAVYWTPEGEAHDLNDLIAAGSPWILQTAQDINNNGQIIGWGVRTDLGGLRGFVLTPIDPECPADLSGDGIVDSADLNILLAAFGAIGETAGDVDGDGDTDSADLNGLLAAFGLSCG